MMATPELQGTWEDPSELVDRKEEGKEPPAKMVWIDELEVSIAKIVDRSVLKATRG